MVSSSIFSSVGIKALSLFGKIRGLHEERWNGLDARWRSEATMPFIHSGVTGLRDMSSSATGQNEVFGTRKSGQEEGEIHAARFRTCL
nr:hypothetical protein CFP56_59643 [Quercus suber]